MMDNIRKAFREEVADLTWIDSETKPRLYQKVYFFIGLLHFLDCRAAMRTDTHTLEKKKNVFILVKILYLVDNNERIWMGGWKCQLSVKILSICQLSVKFWGNCQLSVKCQLIIN